MNLRPQTLDDYIGNADLKYKLKILIHNAKERNESLPHILLDGSSGCGKSTLATIIANEMGRPIQIANGGNLRSIKQIVPYLSKLEPGSILFIDEIHRLTKMVEEFLYPVMEDFRMDIGGTGRVSIDLPKFTLIGATTESGSISKPLLNRFQVVDYLKTYTVEELAMLVKKTATRLGLTFSTDCAKVVAERSRGVARIANNFVIWIHNYLSYHNLKPSVQNITAGMDKLGIDSKGFTEKDHKYISTIKTQFNGGPVSLNVIQSATGIDENTITEVVEPFLISNGMLIKSTKGRVLV